MVPLHGMRGSDFGSPWMKLRQRMELPFTSRVLIAIRLWMRGPCLWTFKVKDSRVIRRNSSCSERCRGICSCGIHGRFTRLMDPVMVFGRRTVVCWEELWPRERVCTTTSGVPEVSCPIWAGMDLRMGISCQVPSSRWCTQNLTVVRQQSVIMEVLDGIPGILRRRSEAWLARHLETNSLRSSRFWGAKRSETCEYVSSC
mmetsp:Transcript_2519/g.5348  ORF Transcript_2519/g.5348 Transcript_2519/m.5348 type:complete len:200 (+) Transcript_2519:846-1445(+)